MGTRIIAVANQKGGVAKTTSTITLGHVLYARGARVLMIDSDPQGSLSISSGIDQEELTQLDAEQRTYYYSLVKKRPLDTIILKREGKPDLVPAALSLTRVDQELQNPFGAARFLRELLAPVLDRYDVILIDCPPSASLLTVNALVAAHGVLIPSKTDFLSMSGVTQTLEVIDEVRANANPTLSIVGILPTAYDARSTKHDGRILEQIRLVGNQHGIHVFEPVHLNVAYKQASVEGTSVLEYSPGAPGIDVYELIGQHIYAA